MSSHLISINPYEHFFNSRVSQMQIGTDIERNDGLEEETVLIASTENENLNCSAKGKNAISTLPP